MSASRRTDIPAFYARWFMERVRDGYCETVNPFNPLQRGRVSLLPEDVAVIVFWSKDPRPLLPYLKELEAAGYHFCFQFTLTGYGPRLEKYGPTLETAVRTFQNMAELLGPDRMAWRYDPILFSDHTGLCYHQAQFSRLAELLRGCTGRVTISFFDDYRGALASLTRGGIRALPNPAGQELAGLAEHLACSARKNNLEIYSCAEKPNLKPFGINPGRCIDPAWLGRLFNINLPARKDKGQRPLCGCAPSKDIGRYGTCRHGCLYCYAGKSAWRRLTRSAHR
ncbi:MAG: DUF1848 domain-containing protein [Bacillota bacterium]